MKKRFTLEEHLAISAKLEQIRNDLTLISVEIYNSYPRRAVSDDLYKATKFIDKVRSELDEQVHKENPNLDGDVADHIYYGTSRKDQDRKN
jgi:hypothetical protein